MNGKLDKIVKATTLILTLTVTIVEGVGELISAISDVVESD